MAWFLIHTMLIVVDGLMDSPGKADVALILGNTVHENGKMSARLQSRVEKGLDLYRAGRVKTIVVSGGLGKEGFYEAEVMKNYLLAQQVPAARVIVDNKGNTTQLTALNFNQIRKKLGFRSVIVVSQYYHLSRTKLALRNLGMENVYSAHAPYFEFRDLYSLVREFFGFYAYLLQGLAQGT
ncbi:YdcF family protein [Hymenobacter montanus]|uniref:YdcF family protein n=1 Tax=Hymenobacter montanus TaxID=2771359 RepID=UPI001CC2C0A3|nr:YdcF family protein [Hymenobacter montanus]